MNPTAITIAGIPGFGLLWVLTAVAVFIFGAQVIKYVRTLSRARKECRSDHIGKRAKALLVNVFGQRRMFEEPVIGIAHLVIFYAFVFYALSFWWNLVKGLIPSLPIPFADDVPFMSVALEILGVVALLGLTAAAIRRYLFTPERLERTADATIILCLITLVLITFLGGQGFKAATHSIYNLWSPVGSLLGERLNTSGLSGEAARPYYVAFWWAHMIVVLFFLAYLPHSKHMHLLVSPFGVFWSNLQKGPAPQSSEGATHLEEFTWRELFNGLACAECGRCDRSCPALAEGSPLSPKMLMHAVKEFVRQATKAKKGEEKVSLVGSGVSEAEIWACANCYACMERCPVLNEHVPVLIEMRRYLVSQGRVDARLQETLVNLTRYGNSFGKSPRQRGQWVRSLEAAPKDARKEAVDLLWFTGDYAAYDPRVQEASVATARILQAAGIDFGLLYEGEQNAGNDVRRVGEEGLFQMLVEKNLKSLSRAQFKRLLTTDPHSFHTLKNEFPWHEIDGGEKPPIQHHSELFDVLLSEGKIKVQRPLQQRVTYHDPCYLGRCNEVYDAPRRVLQAIGVELIEMPRHRSRSFCCGAGGGRIWMEDIPGIKERPAENRVREAASLPDVSTLVVACPKDLVMFGDAIKTCGLEEKLRVRELATLVAEATLAASAESA